MLSVSSKSNGPIQRKVKLSRVQRALVASHKRSPEFGHQNAALVIRFLEEIEPQKLTDAFNEVVENIEILRLRLVKNSSSEAVVVEVVPSQTTIVETDFSSFRKWAMNRAMQPLDLYESCYESRLAVHGDGTTSWYLNLHHVINDGSSAALVLSAVENVYLGGDVKNQNYFDEEFTLPDQSSAKEYWGNRRSANQIGRLYADLTHDAVSATQIVVERDEDHYRLLHERMAGKYRLLTPGLTNAALTIFSTALYVHRLSGEPNFSVGIVVNHRTNSNTRKLIGPGFDMFPVDVQVNDGDTYHTLYKRVANSMMQTLKNAEDGTSPSSDFNAVVNILPADVATKKFASSPCRVSWLHSGSIDSTYVLRVMSSPYAPLMEQPRDEANSPALLLDLKDAALGTVSAGQAMEHFRRLQNDALANPDNPLGAISLCSPEELVQTIQSLPPVSRNQEATLSASLELALKDNPETVIYDDKVELTGSQLWDWSCAIADDLLTDKAERKGRVGILLRPSIQAVAAIYGAVLAGRPFVPLDSEEPKHRIKRLSERAELCRVFSSTQEVDALKPRDVYGESKIAADIETTDEAYLLFTSGSSGDPKGVPINRQGLSDYIHHAGKTYFENIPRPVAPLFGALKFDLTITTLFAPVLNGGAIYTYEKPARNALPEIARNPHLNWMKATPSHLKILLHLLTDNVGLQTLVVGGEAFSSKLATDLFNKNANLTIFNEYGPTEAVVGCVVQKITKQSNLRRTEVPIGLPIDGVSLLTVDTYGQPVVPGAAGELWISHSGVMSGYLDGSDQDAQFGYFDGLKYYRSGDLVRQDLNGVLTYLGRIDTQLKLNGIRLDPVEIEEALTHHPDIAQAVVRVWAPQAVKPRHHCLRCGLPDNVPEANIDGDGICQSCHSFDAVKDIAGSWFGIPDDLKKLIKDANSNSESEYDCMHLLSGGKDSTYALYQLVELGAKPYVLTLDNGYISPSAKENIDRVVKDLKLDHEYATPESMKRIFQDSLERHSNVCNGCYKSLYTMATARADSLNIKVIVTGLSRGQLFETRLIPQQFDDSRFDKNAIDRTILMARKNYHRVRDACSSMPEAAVFGDEAVFDRVQYVDFYRYFDVELSSMLAYLSTKTGWIRPTDTGRSTNCLINEMGIFTHLEEQGYHNYAIPYAWDVRLGHKTRDEAIEELEDDLDKKQMEKMLAEVGYTPRKREFLTAWYVPHANSIPASELHAFTSRRLPAYALPKNFVEIPELPLTANGKVDESALPAPDQNYNPRTDFVVEVENDTEREIIEIWERELEFSPIQRDDDFFSLGGDSLSAIRAIMALSEKLDSVVSEEFAFTHTTPARLAVVVNSISGKTPRPANSNQVSPIKQEYTSDAPPPMSVGEQAILFEHLSAPETLRYNAARIYWVDGDIDSQKYVEAAQQVATLHVPLTWTYGARRKPIESDDTIELSIVENDQSEADVERHFRSIVDVPFDVDKGPLFRLTLCTCDNGQTAIQFVIHHVACDHESFDVLWHQIAHCYETGHLPKIENDYASYVQQHWTKNDSANRRFWLEREFEEPAELKPLSASQSSTQDGYINRQLRLANDDLGKGQRSPLAARGMSAVAMALKPYLIGDVIDLSLLMTARISNESKELVGYMLNPLPCQIKCQDQLSIGELIEGTQQNLAKILPHSNYPFPQIHADRKNQDLTVPQSKFLLSIVEHGNIELAGMEVRQEMVSNKNAVTDATFFLQKTDHGLELGLEYKRSVFPDEIASNILDNFRDALTQIHSSPNTRLRKYFGERETLSILHGEPLAEIKDVYEQIVDHMSRDLSRPAVECGEEMFTWGELKKCSSYLATQIKKNSVSKGDLVAIALPRGCAYVAAIIAIHSLGAGYVPIDLSNTQNRIDKIIEIAQPTLVLHDNNYEKPANGLDVSNAMSDRALWNSTRAQLAKKLPSKDLVAYVIFTSGSTGRPKGVPITHRQLAHSNSARAGVYANQPSTFLLLSSFAFDSSIVGVFWTLSNGGTLITMDDEAIHDPDSLIAIFKNRSLDYTLCVPTLYKMLLARQSSLEGEHWPDTVILAGEALPSTLVQDHFSLFGTESALVNEYGPTEASVWALSHKMTVDDLNQIPIGKPVPGTWIAIVDADNQPVPAGIAGDLMLGGPNIASGYIGNLEESKKRFLDGNKLNLPSHSVFKTGDKVVLHHGQVQFLGRMDDQLNIGGVRVEPGEIEAAICRQPGVKDAVVFADDPRTIENLIDSVPADRISQLMKQSAVSENPAQTFRENLQNHIPAMKKLVAHVNADTAMDSNVLREGLKDILPPILVPTEYHFHNEFPVTQNGKVDRQKVINLTPVDQPIVKPVSTVTSQTVSSKELDRLSSLFVKILENPGFQPTDSFFVFGGNSLTALHLIFEIETEFDTQISTTALYKNPSPVEMLKHLEELGVPLSASSSLASIPPISSKPKRKNNRNFALPIQMGGTRIPIIAVHTLGKNGEIFADLSKALGPDQPFWGVGENAFINMYGGWVSDPNGPTAVPDVVRGYVDEVFELVPSGPIILAGFCLGAQYAYELAQQLKERGREPALLIILHDLHAPERARQSETELEFARKQRLAQMREKKLASIPRIIKKIPDFSIRFLLEMKRQHEIRQLRRYKSSNKPLTPRLAERDFVERSYVAAHAYENKGYSGDVLIVRRNDPSVYLNLSENNGYGSRLVDAEVHEITTDAFDLILNDPHSHEIAKIIGLAIDARISQEKAKSAPLSSDIEVSADKILATDHQFVKGNADHQIKLMLNNQNYIDAPRAEQRDWLINQRLRELSEELDHLDAAAPKMIAATGNLVVEGRQDARLKPDEIMEDWQIPLMKEMAKITAQNGGHILEIGFGRGISAAMIQEWKPDAHTLIEVNQTVIDDYYQDWLKAYPGRDIRMVKGLWQDVIDQLDQHDGLLFHTYPLSAEEMYDILSNSSTFAEHFFPVAAKLLKPGGRFTYFTNDADSISRTHQRALLEHFESFRIGRISDLEIPEDSADAQWFSDIVTVEAIAK